MEGTYLKALEQAERELAEADKEMENVERKRAKLRQAVKTLRSLLGRSPEDQTITDAILEIAKSVDGYVLASEVMERIEMAGYVASAATVATTLSRLVKEKQLEKGAEGGYRWAGVPKWAHEFGKGIAEAMAKVGTDESIQPPTQAPRTLRRRL